MTFHECDEVHVTNVHIVWQKLLMVDTEGISTEIWFYVTAHSFTISWLLFPVGPLIQSQWLAEKLWLKPQLQQGRLAVDIGGGTNRHPGPC